MDITRERWDEAQAAECEDHLVNLANSPDSLYHHGESLVAQYVGLDLKNDVKDKFVIEVGAGPKGAILLTGGNFKRGIVVEPLIDKFPPEVRKVYEDMGVEVVTEMYEDVDYGAVDETWFFNVLQHVISPEKQLQKAKENSDVVRIFEPINYPANISHPHVLTKELFTGIFGQDFGSLYVGGSRSDFHTADCYYGTWIKED